MRNPFRSQEPPPALPLDRIVIRPIDGMELRWLRDPVKGFRLGSDRGDLVVEAEGRSELVMIVDPIGVNRRDQRDEVLRMVARWLDEVGTSADPSEWPDSGPPFPEAEVRAAVAQIAEGMREHVVLPPDIDSLAERLWSLLDEGQHDSQCAWRCLRPSCHIEHRCNAEHPVRELRHRNDA